LVDLREIADCATRIIRDSALASDLGRATALFQALDLLPGCYEDWALMERERMRQRVLHALEALSRQLSRMGRHAEAVDVALAAVDAEPLRESAQRVLFEAYIDEGNWVEARRAYHAYRGVLRRDLRIEPSAGLAQLVGLSEPRPTVAGQVTGRGVAL
jgi:DNA-binding SARP family transcriptional activator